MTLWIIFGAFALLSWIVSSRLKSKFEKYSNISIPYTGAQVAEMMLRQNGINNVRIQPVDGTLTDFYNPSDRTVNLSTKVYDARTVAAAAVAAHETGHALQHAQDYKAMALRTALVPLQNISSTILNVIFIGMFALSFIMPNLMPYTLALKIIIACYAVFTLFAFVTLGVEIDASRRAINWLTASGVIVAGETRDGAVDALKWAAYTYLVAALSSLATLLYYILQLSRSRD
ncbi:MAG: zinc metallopeptidase [Bacteroidales bacterium]|nr:zinc metallopeptidase [Bacteroidales bacterium]MDY4174612.1 zinc metallopeptidase [Bacteroidales bacterium]